MLKAGRVLTSRGIRVRETQQIYGEGLVAVEGTVVGTDNLEHSRCVCEAYLLAIDVQTDLAL